MTNVQAAIGVGQIEKVEELVEARRKNALLYAKYLDIPGLILPVEKDYAKNVYWMYGIVLDDSVKKSKEQVMEELKEKGIDTRSFFVPLHKQPYLQKMLGSESYPVAEWLGERGLYLPSSSSLTEEDVKQVCEAVKEVLA
jgi:perosamine synthetase